MKVADITVVLNIYKRSYLTEQLRLLRAQTFRPKEIWIIHLGNHIDIQSTLKTNSDIKYIRSDVDIKFFGRFSLAKFVNTEYCLILDDDIMPSPLWLEMCLNTCRTYNAIVCCNGRIIPPGDLTPEVPKSDVHLSKYFIGDAIAFPFNHCHEDTVVDYPSSSYFFRKEWLKYFWAIEPCFLDMGDDIHLGASCKILAGIDTIVPMQDSLANSGNTRPAYSSDCYSSWSKPGFHKKRSVIFKYLINRQNWRPMLWTK